VVPLDERQDERRENRRTVAKPTSEERDVPKNELKRTTESEAPPESSPASSPWRRRAWWAMGILLPIVVLLVTFAVDRSRMAGRVLRGASVWGLDVGRMTEAEAAHALQEHREEVAASQLLVRVGERQFEIVPSEIGFGVDLDPAVAEAMAVGRTGGGSAQLLAWVQQWMGGADVSVVATIEEKAALRVIHQIELDAIDDSPFDGAVTIVEAEPQPDYPRAGWVMDVPTALERVRAALASGGAGEVVELPIVRQVSRHERSDVDAAVSQAERLLAGSVELVESDASVAKRAIKPDSSDPAPPPKKKKASEDEPLEPWRLTYRASDLAAAFRSRPRPEPERGIELYFDARALTDRLEDLRGSLEEPAIDARFEFDEKDQVSIISSRPGTRVDEEQVAAALLEAAQREDRTGALPIERGASPKFTTADAEALRIRGLVSKFTTYHPCCQPRVHNIHRISEMIDGVVLGPGDTLSINEFIGPRTTDKGYVPAPSIADGQMVDTVGGGVSQFATTLFNAVLDGGYDIVERAPHSYYFRRYPVGHEATLSFPKPDLVFRNDTGAGLVVRIETGSSYIRVKLYGDNEGRKVEREVSRAFDLKEPDTEYIANDTMDPEEEEEREKGSDGWSVRVTRIITFADGTKKEESRKVRYKPRDRVVEVHSCRIPKKKKGHTGEKCPEPEPEEDEPEQEPDEEPDESVETSPARASDVDGDPDEAGG